MDVVHRVEATPGQEGEIAAVAGEDGVLVLEAAVGDIDYHRGVGARDPGQFDLPQGPAHAWVRPGQPVAVRGERQIADRAVHGADEFGDLGGVHLGPGLHEAAFDAPAVEVLDDLDDVDDTALRLRGVQQEEPAVVRGDGQPLALRVGDQLVDPAQLPGGQPAGRAVAAGPGEVGDLDRVVALRVRDVRDLAAAAEHLRQPDPHPRGVGDRTGGAVAVGEPVQAAAHGDRARPARLVDGQRVDVGGRRYLVRTPAGPGPSEPHVQFPGLRVRGLQVLDQPQIAAALVDHPAAVAGGVPGVERVVVRVPAQIGAVHQAGVQIADALVVGEEGDAAPDEHRRVQVPADVRQQPLAVQPEPAHGAAPVPLPGRRLVRRLSGEEQGAPLAVDVGDRDVGDGPPRELAAGAPVGGDAVRPGEVGERLVVRGHGEDLGGVPGVGAPAADPGVGRAPVGESAGGAALDGGEVDLWIERAPGRVGDAAAVGREARMTDPGPVDGQPPRPAGPLPLRGERGDPEVVLRREAEQVLVEVRETKIRDVVTHPPMLSVRRARGNLWCRTQAKLFRFAEGGEYLRGVRNSFVPLVDLRLTYDPAGARKRRSTHGTQPAHART